MTSTKLPRQVPWRDWEEWIFVYEHLFSFTREDRVAAIEIVSMWKLRGKVPHSIESSAGLVQLSLKDEENEKSSLYSDLDLRFQYSLAIIRSVNGLVDNSQQGMFAESVLMLAERMGLPGWIVELRHDATHNDLPSLALLRSATSTLLDWFVKNYWDVQCRYLTELTEKITLLLNTDEKANTDEEGPEAIGANNLKPVAIPSSSASSSTSASSGVPGTAINNSKLQPCIGVLNFIKGSSAALLTGIVIPFFLEATILCPQSVNVDAEMIVEDPQTTVEHAEGSIEETINSGILLAENAITLENNKDDFQKEFWMLIIREISIVYTFFPGTILTRLFDTAVDILKAIHHQVYSQMIDEIEISTWELWLRRLSNIMIWIQFITAEFINKSDKPSISTAKSAITTPCCLFLRSLEDQFKCQLHDIEQKVDLVSADQEALWNCVAAAKQLSISFDDIVGEYFRCVKTSIDQIERNIQEGASVILPKSKKSKSSSSSSSSNASACTNPDKRRRMLSGIQLPSCWRQRGDNGSNKIENESGVCDISITACMPSNINNINKISTLWPIGLSGDKCPLYALQEV